MARRASERRRHKRLELKCPITMAAAAGEPIGRSRTANISDGGALVYLPAGELPACGSEVDLAISVPRRTANTYMLEEFASRAKVLRHQPPGDDPAAAVAFQFAEPLALGLEV